MKNLNQILTDVRSQIQTMKTQQKSQNDSYQFYKYLSPNLYNDGSVSSSRAFTLEFLPTSRLAQDVLCIFRVSDYANLTGSGEAHVIFVSTSNPLKAYVSTYSGTYAPEDWTKTCYVEVFSNVKGILRTTELS